MKIREIIPLLSSNPIFSQSSSSNAITPKKSITDNNNELSQTPKNFISVNNSSSEIYYYSPIEKKLYVIKIESTLDNTIGSIKYQELKVNFEFEVYKIELNQSSRYLCIVGNVNCVVVDLNPQTLNLYFSGKEIYQDLENKTYGYEAIDVNYFPIDRSFFKSSITNIIKQVEWHPLSNNHLVILFSNNILKIFNIQKNEEIEQIFNLESIYTYESLKNLKTNNIEKEKKNTKTFISFCFGPNCNYWSRFTIFLLSSDGEIFNLCPVIPNNCLIENNFYKDFQNHIVYEKNQCKNIFKQQQQQQQQSNTYEQQLKYYDQQFKWLMCASVENVPISIDPNQISYLKLSTPNYGSLLLQGPIYKVSENIKSDSSPLKIVSVSPLLSNLDQYLNQEKQQQDDDDDDDDDEDDDKEEEKENIYNNNNSKELSLNDLSSNSFNKNKKNKKKKSIVLKPNQKLVPFIITILLESCECLVNICCQDTVPMWSNLFDGILFNEKEKQQPKYTDLILYETLDLNLKKLKSTSSSNGYLSYNLPTMKYDQWSDSLYFYHNQGVQNARFPWLTQIYNEINSYDNEDDASLIDENIQFEPTSLVTLISNDKQNISIIGIQVFSNIKIGTYFIVLPNTFKLIVFDMDALNTLGGSNFYTTESTTTTTTITTTTATKTTRDVSPLKKFIDKKPTSISKIILPNQFTQKEFLQTLVTTKKKLYNLYIYSKEFECELRSRIKTLEILNNQNSQMVEILSNRIENIKKNQQILNEKMKYVWNKKEINTQQINLLYTEEMENKPLSNEEKELKKQLKQIKGQINIYSERINQIENQQKNGILNNNNNNNNNNEQEEEEEENEEISEETQREIKKVLTLHDQKIEKDVNQLLKLLKNAQINN